MLGVSSEDSASKFTFDPSNPSNPIQLNGFKIQNSVEETQNPFKRLETLLEILEEKKNPKNKY